MNVAAWPRCVASYGVIPHVYISTCSLGSNGTIARSAVSYSCIAALIGSRLSRSRLNSPRVPFDSRELRRDTRLVPDVKLEQHGRERLDRGGIGEFAGVERS